MPDIIRTNVTLSWIVTFFLMFSILSVNCVSPSARYTRSSKQSGNHYVVTGNWDYRKHYTVPQDRLKKTIDSYLGTCYRWGGTTRKGMDCSGFVKTVYAEVSHAKLPRTSYSMSKLGHSVTRAKARPGDLIFFRGGIFNRINHVGIYMGKGRFAHASSSKGVKYSSLNTDYYRRRFAGIRRVF